MTTFAPLFVPAGVREAVSDRAWLAAMLRAEGALARASAAVGLIPAGAADAIVQACDASRYDIADLCEQGRPAGNPVEPFVRALRERVGGEAAAFVHRGATSQDILDTAAMLVARDALVLIDADVDLVLAACARLAREQRGTMAAARTLLQQAVPTTFGLRAAGWLVGVLDARALVRAFEPAAQLGGAAGTLAALGDRGPEVLHLYARELGLAEPALPWHANRVRVAQLGGALDVVAGALAKIATDVVLLAAFGEVAESDAGVSSTMPQKRNPAGSTLARAAAASVHAHASVLTGGIAGELERAAGAWHAEWGAWSGVLAWTGAAAAAMRRVLDGLEVDAARMRANIDPAVMSEKVSLAGGELPEPEREPETYLGAAGVFVDRALARWEAQA